MHLIKKYFQGTQKWHWNFDRLSGFEVIDQNCQNTGFWSITQEPLGLPWYRCYFWVSLTICFKMHYYFSKRCW